MDAVSSAIAVISSSTAITGHKGIKLLDEINSFPSFYVYTKNKTITHLGDGTQIHSLDCALRGYGMNDDAEYTARLYETAISTIRNAKLLSLRIDDGLMAPYTIIDITFEMLVEK